MSDLHYTLDDFKKLICYRLSPGDTVLPSIPFFDMAITFYMLIGNTLPSGTLSVDDDKDDEGDKSDEESKDDKGDKGNDECKDEAEDTTAATDLKQLLESGIFEFVNGHIISPITSDSLHILNCSTDDLLPIAKLNTPELSPPKMLALEDAVVLSTIDGLYGATAILYEGALEEVAHYLQFPRFHLLPISEHGVLCTNSLTLDHQKALLMNEQKPLTRSVYEYDRGTITVTP